MKKYLVLLLVFALCMGTYAVPALAEEAAYDIKVQAEHYDVYNWLYDIGADGVIQAYNGNSGEYILEFAESGVYEVSISAAIQQKMTQTMQLFLDGTSQGSVTFAKDDVSPGSSVYNTYVAGKINVTTPGRHTVKLLLTSGNIKLDYFTLTRTSDITITKKSQSYTASASKASNIGSDRIALNVNLSEYVEYAVNFPAAGTYDMILSCGTPNNVYLSVKLNDVGQTLKKSYIANNTTDIYTKFVDENICSLVIPEAGTYRVYIKPTVSYLTIKNIIFTRTGEFSVSKSGKEYDAAASSIGTNGADHIQMYSASSYATYNIDIPAPGVYALKGRLSGYYGSSYIKTEFDGKVVKEKMSAAVSGGLAAPFDANLGYVYVDKAGTYALKIIPLNGNQVRVFSVGATYAAEKPGVYMTTSWDAENKKVNYVVNNYTGSDITDAVLFSAVYSQDGTTLRDVDRVETTLKVGANSVSTETLNYASRNKVKAFIWDSVDDIKPIVKEQYVNPCN